MQRKHSNRRYDNDFLYRSIGLIFIAFSRRNNTADICPPELTRSTVCAYLWLYDFVWPLVFFYGPHTNQCSRSLHPSRWRVTLRKACISIYRLSICSFLCCCCCCCSRWTKPICTRPRQRTMSRTLRERSNERGALFCKIMASVLITRCLLYTIWYCYCSIERTEAISMYLSWTVRSILHECSHDKWQLQWFQCKQR